MKRILSALLAALLCAGAVCASSAGAEPILSRCEPLHDGNVARPVRGIYPRVVQSPPSKPNAKALGLFSAPTPRDREWIVGTDIGFDDIAEFYYTYDASYAPPQYQRYHVYREGDRVLLYHETREGGGWPQTEADITASGTVALSDAALERLRDCLSGGTVRKRGESLDDGDAGPWMYLYWSGDQGEIQEFSFESWGKQLDFEALCAELRDAAS